MSRIVVAAGAAALVAASMSLVTAMQEPRPARVGGAVEAAPGRRGSTATLPAEVPPGLVVGWNTRKVARSKGLTEVTLDGAKTLNRDEVVARLQAEGCHAPEVLSSGRWEVRCAAVGGLTEVAIRECVHAGEGVLSWKGESEP